MIAEKQSKAAKRLMLLMLTGNAVGLAISRRYQIGRIYDVLYFCRRHDENSDASLSVEKENMNNTYKDRVRTWELEARIALNAKKK